jgi:aspartate carbamoyltransferase regulatory subunit
MASRDLRFCTKCSNMLYLREVDGDSSIRIQEFCRRCGYCEDPMTPETTTEGNIIVYERIIGNRLLDPQINEIVFSDPAVPSTREIDCPNESCPSHREGVEPMARFIVLQQDNLDILYYCVHCHTMWKNKRS